MGREFARREEQERLCGRKMGVACCHFFADLRGWDTRINDCDVWKTVSLSEDYGLNLSGRYGRAFVIMFSDNTISARQIHFRTLNAFSVVERVFR